MGTFLNTLIFTLLVLATSLLALAVYPRVAVQVMFAALLCFGAMLVLAVRNGQ